MECPVERKVGPGSDPKHVPDSVIHAALAGERGWGGVKSQAFA